MTTGAHQQAPLSFEEYLRFEQMTDVRHEYVGGQVFAMTGGSVRHGQMSALIAALLLQGFEARGCRVQSHDTKLRVPLGATYYPDVFVSCGPPADTHFDDDATWVVEVLSDSTRDKDEREKSVAYLRLPSIRGYLLVETSSRTIQLRTAAEVGWHITWYHDGDVLDLDGIQIKVADLYDRLDRLAPPATTIA
ncbi:MAG TPA: Uma2 family endonuclease [Kineosporiaceae bacterium]|jgi:Uma2 family endonuclease|nr:Uma2 family endonuclease [Kineosporiaceae bacterium]